MKKYKLVYRIELWELIWIIISIMILFGSKCFSNDSFIFSTLIGIATCIITAILILYFQRIQRNRGLYNYYIPISGKYTRTDIGQDNTNENDIKEQNINLIISLEYLGENKFKADIEYWKNDNAKAIGFIEFNDTNKLIASGTYKYYQGQKFTNHFGTLDVFRFNEQPNRLYVKYQHIFPREIGNNPDNNRGWKIWDKNN